MQACAECIICTDKQRLHVGSAKQLAAYLVEKFCSMSPGHSSSRGMDRQRGCRSWGIILLMEMPLDCTAHAQHSMRLTLQSACCNSSNWRSCDMSADSNLLPSPGMRLQLPWSVDASWIVNACTERIALHDSQGVLIEGVVGSGLCLALRSLHQRIAQLLELSQQTCRHAHMHCAAHLHRSYDRTQKHPMLWLS